MIPASCTRDEEEVSKTGELIGMLSLHIDDEGITGTDEVIAEFILDMTARFGEVKVQKDKFRHIGHEYTH